MDYDELVQRLRDWSDTHSFSAVPRSAADAITKLRAERDALRHDIERHVAITAEQAQEIERLRERAESAETSERPLLQLRDELLAENERLRGQRGAFIEAVESARKERDAYARAMAQMNAPALAVVALQRPPPIIMPARDWELHQKIQTLNERLAYLEPIFIAARNLVDNAEEYECDGLGLFAQHGWWEPLHDALDPDGAAAADDIRQPVTPAK